MIPNISIAIASFFLYPLLCHSIGISPARSLSFPSRSLTLALAQPATQNLGGDLSLVAVLALLSGIMGVLVGPQMLKMLRIPEGMITQIHQFVATANRHDEQMTISLGASLSVVIRPRLALRCYLLLIPEPPLSQACL